MSLLKKEYLCQVTIVEGRELASTDGTGSCDPFVKVTCGNAASQATTTIDGTNSPSWNQSFTFSKLSLTDAELESWELKIDCINFNAFIMNKLIGGYSIGLATLNRNSNHEFYNTWITLLHPDYGSIPRGYLLINCFIVGPDDVPPAHAIGEQMGLDEDAEDSDEELDDLLTAEQRKLKKLKKQAISTVKTPLIAKKSYQLSVNIYKAERIPKIGDSERNPFVSVRCCGLVDRTHVLESNSNPIWNLKMSFPSSTPILNDRITIRVWDHRPRSRDKLIATLPEIPNDHDFYSISNLITRGGVLPCRWISLYGPSEEEDTIWNDIKKLTGLMKKSYLGTCFLGRILISMAVSSNEDPESGVSKATPYREPASKTYQLRATLYELKNAEECGDEVQIILSIGDHKTKSRRVKKKEKIDPESGEKLVGFIWGNSYSGEALSEIKEPFTVDPTQIPDIFINLYSKGLLGEKRIGYIRKPATEIIGNSSPMWIPFKSIDKHSNIGAASPGLLLISIVFGVEFGDNTKANKLKPRKVDHTFCWNIYGGLDMAPSIEDKDTNLFLKIYCGDSVIIMDDSVRKNKTGKYPIWRWCGVKTIKLHEDLHFELNMRVEVHNKFDSFKLFTHEQEIGQFSVPVYACNTRWKQPHFFHVVNSNEEGVSQGRIIADFFITKEKIEASKNPCAESLDMHTCDVQIALIGIRGLKPPYEQMKITLEIPGYTTADGKPAEKVLEKKNVGKVDKSNPNILEIVTFKGVSLPVKPIFLPAIYIKIEDTALLSWNKSFTYISLINYCNWIEHDIEKREAIEQYNKNFTEKELLEQLPYEFSRKEFKASNLDFEIITNYGSDDEPIKHEDYEETNEKIGKIEKQKKKMMLEDIFEPKNSRISHKIQFDKDSDDEDAEIELRKQTAQKLESELEIMKQVAKAKLEKKGDVPEKIKSEIRKIEKSLEFAKSDPIKEFQFLKKDEEFEDDGTFQYNRPIYKNGLLEETLTLPYNRFELYRKSKDTKKLSLHRVGEPIGAVLKASVALKVHKSNEKNEEYPDVEKMEWDLDFFHPIFEGNPYLIEQFHSEKIVLRVYLLRALSLCAVNNASDLPAIAAGLEALSTATSYPEVLIGDSELK
jgi:C2 domain